MSRRSSSLSLLLFKPQPSAKPVPGCLGISVVCLGLFVCLWLTITSGFGTALLTNTPVISVPVTIPFPNTHLAAVVHAEPANTYNVLGKPSLSAAFIDHVLAYAHSPARGTGSALYRLSLTYGIDDAYALAFFQHESQFGTTGMARITLSLGNIRCSAGYQCFKGYRAYATWLAGYQDWYHLLATLYVQQWHLRTVAQIIPVYAPSSDGNDVAGYIAAVEHAVDTWRKDNDGEVA